MKIRKEKKPFGSPANIPASRNPAIAYKQGYERGLEDKKSSDVICGFEFLQSLLLLVFYNTNIDGKFLSQCRCYDFYRAVQDELCRIKDDVIEPDKGITNEDKIMLLEAWGGKAEEEFLEAVARREKREAKKLENKT